MLKWRRRGPANSSKEERKKKREDERKRAAVVALTHTTGPRHNYNPATALPGQPPAMGSSAQGMPPVGTAEDCRAEHSGQGSDLKSIGIPDHPFPAARATQRGTPGLVTRHRVQSPCEEHKAWPEQPCTAHISPCPGRQHASVNAPRFTEVVKILSSRRWASSSGLSWDTGPGAAWRQSIISMRLTALQPPSLVLMAHRCTRGYGKSFPSPAAQQCLG